MRNFLKAAAVSLGIFAGGAGTGAAQDFGAMNFGGAGDFGTPQASGTSKATVTSYGETPFVIVTELTLLDHWHVYYKNPGTVGLPMEAAFQPVPGFRVEGPFWQIPELGKGLVDFYGYSGKAKMAFRVTPEKDAPGSDVHHHHDVANVRGTMRRTGDQRLQRDAETRRRTGRPRRGRTVRRHGGTFHPRMGAGTEGPDFPGRKNRHPAPQDERATGSGRFRLFLLRPGGNQPHHSPDLQKTEWLQLRAGHAVQ
ncbi:MAG: hypothetical protein ACLT38_08605 [Akkermansia sp.]